MNQDLITTVIAVVGLFLALYGSILSTSLYIRARKRDKRRIVARLEYLFAPGHYELVIVNVGFRPVTITGVSVDQILNDNGGTYRFPVDSDVVFDKSEGEDLFPFTLEDGQQRNLIVGQFMTEESLRKYGDKLKVLVYDAERNSYEADTRHTYKLGHDYS